MTRLVSSSPIAPAFKRLRCSALQTCKGEALANKYTQAGVKSQVLFPFILLSFILFDFLPVVELYLALDNNLVEDVG